MKLVQRGNRQLRVADDAVESMLDAGYMEVDGNTGKPLRPAAPKKDINALKKENDALRKENESLKARLEAQTPNNHGLL